MSSVTRDQEHAIFANMHRMMKSKHPESLCNDKTAINQVRVGVNLNKAEFEEFHGLCTRRTLVLLHIMKSRQLLTHLMDDFTRVWGSVTKLNAMLPTPTLEKTALGCCG